jgi:hypothetical protein
MAVVVGHDDDMGNLEFTTVQRMCGPTSLAALGRCRRSWSMEFLQHTTLTFRVFCFLVDGARIDEEVLASSVSRGLRGNAGRPGLDLGFLVHVV